MKESRLIGSVVNLNRRRFSFGLPLLAAGATLSQKALAAKPAPGGKAPVVTHYRTSSVEGIKIFYREAGPRDAPVMLLLHGFPTSSHMFRNLVRSLRTAIT